MVGFLDDSPPYVRPILFAVGGLALLSLVRILAGAPDLTAGDTFIAAIGAMSPIVFAASGGLFSERVGVVNIGLEGMMILGTWFAGWAGWHWGPWAAIVAGAIGGALGGLLLALATVTFGVDHIVAGIAINLLAPGVCRFLSSEVFVGQRGRDDHAVPDDVGDDRPLHRSRSSPAGRCSAGRRRTCSAGSTRSGGSSSPTWPASAGASRPAWPSPPSSRWPCVPISAYLLWRTPFGLRLRSIGEKPSAADSLGVAVYRIKYIGVTISGALAGLGGAWLAIDVRAYNEDQVAGRGFQGLAALDLRQLAPGGHRRRRRALRVRAVAHPAHRHRTGAGPVPPRRAVVGVGIGRRPVRPPPGAAGHRRARSWAASPSSTT